ncbi:iron uptake protein [Roseateles koreensis]|uniref:Iron uptake protein n=1 Tax=Roseateles koreensis TaxID=2987526 RepID=A0ABT5KLP3_9BURK|nr:iron uptake protein [Roseateles koreensis]MDC8783829.1 iron uptake protein [Roseateles koreensis]
MTTPPPPFEVASRIAASFIGGWIFVFGLVMLGIAALLRIGMPYADAQMAMYLLAFLVWLAAFCWCYAAASAWRAWLVLLGGGVAMTALGAWLTPLSI